MDVETKRPEWPTLVVIVVVYALWLLASGVLHNVSPVLSVLVLAIAIAQFSSLQHEVLHGHPFGKPALDALLVFPGINLFIPYLRFKDTHLSHHRDSRLTDPYDDPETNFLSLRHWNALPTFARAVMNWNNTLLGRMVVGPLISQIIFMICDARAVLRGDRRVIQGWVLHVPAAVLVLFWLWQDETIGLWAYLLANYLALSLLKIRTYLEHRAEEASGHRSVIIEDRGPLALLFLNNNLHAVHHRHPTVAWYKLPKLYETGRKAYLERNGGYLFHSYGQVFRSFFVKRKDPVAHPLWRR